MQSAKEQVTARGGECCEVSTVELLCLVLTTWALGAHRLQSLQDDEGLDFRLGPLRERGLFPTEAFLSFAQPGMEKANLTSFTLPHFTCGQSHVHTQACPRVAGQAAKPLIWLF